MKTSFWKTWIAAAVLILPVFLTACRQTPKQQAAAAVEPSVTQESGGLSLRQRLKHHNGSDIPHTEIKWPDLLLLDYKNPKAPVPEKLIELEKQTVKLPGFIVPLTDDYGPFDEFLIVPDQMACIHAPPPPPNQMLYVQTKKPLPIELTFYPLWFYGKLNATKMDSFYGAVGYQFQLQKLELYEKKE